jgi:hypothetical protein
MFTWLSSKAIRTPPTSTPVTNRKASFFKNTILNSLPVYYLEKAYHSLPTIGLTGMGFTINGFSFSLKNIPHNLRKTLMFGIALSQVAKAEAAYYFFTEPSGKTHYKLGLNPSYKDSDSITNEIRTVCNATFSDTPFPIDFQIIQQWSHGTPAGEMVEARLWGGINETREPSFVSCLIDAIERPHPNIKLLIILGIVAGTLATCCAGIVCYKKYVRDRVVAPPAAAPAAVPIAIPAAPIAPVAAFPAVAPPAVAPIAPAVPAASEVATTTAEMQVPLLARMYV